MAFQLLGLGYAAWATLVNDYIMDNDDIQQTTLVRKLTRTPSMLFFDQGLVTPPLVVAQVGPSLTITLVQSDEHPTIAADIKIDFFPLASHPQGALTQAATTVIVQHLSEIGKKAKAAKGHAKLLLLLLHADLDTTTRVITNITQTRMRSRLANCRILLHTW